MKDYLLYIAVAFQGVALALVSLRGDLPSVLLFSVAGLLVGFLTYLEKNQDSRFKKLEEAIQIVRTEAQITALKIGGAF